jgi:hypothetical protein
LWHKAHNENNNPNKGIEGGKQNEKDFFVGCPFDARACSFRSCFCSRNHGTSGYQSITGF